MLNGVGADVGPGCYIGHFGGIVVGDGATISEGCALMQGITIGYGWAGEHRGSPTLGRGVYVAPGAVILGPIVIGEDAMIGANSVVYRDVPAGAYVRPAPVEVVEP